MVSAWLTQADDSKVSHRTLHEIPEDMYRHWLKQDSEYMMPSYAKPIPFYEAKERLNALYGHLGKR